MNRIFFFIYLVILLSISKIAASENLQYQALYKGIFSLGKEIEIADIYYTNLKPIPKSNYSETKILISSEKYEGVESLYPMRYRYRSWYLPDYSSSIAAEIYSNSGSKGEKHKLIYLDGSRELINSQDLSKDNKLDLSKLIDGKYDVRTNSKTINIFDRLGLLENIRSRRLGLGQKFALKVSNGKNLLEYQIKVEKIDTIEIANRNWEAFKLKLEGLKVIDENMKEALHRPVYLWISKESGNLPLLIVSKSSFGRLTIKLQQ